MIKFSAWSDHEKCMFLLIALKNYLFAINFSHDVQKRALFMVRLGWKFYHIAVRVLSGCCKKISHLRSVVKKLFKCFRRHLFLEHRVYTILDRNFRLLIDDIIQCESKYSHIIDQRLWNTKMFNNSPTLYIKISVITPLFQWFQ